MPGKGSRRATQYFAVCSDVVEGFTAKDRLLDLLTFLVLASGTGKDHAHTSWSSQGVASRLGIRKQSAGEAIKRLADTGRLDILLSEGERPTARKSSYQLRVSSTPEARIWLPNAFVDGAAAETPPIRILREVGDIRTALLLLRLYRSLDMMGAGGIDPEVLRTTNPEVRRFGAADGYGLYVMGDGKRMMHAGADLFRGLYDPPLKAAWEAVNTLFRVGLMRWIVCVRTPGPDGIHLGVLDYKVSEKALDMWLNGGERYGSPDGTLFAARSHIAGPIVLDIARPRYLPMTRPVVDGLAAIEDDARQTIAH